MLSSFILIKTSIKIAADLMRVMPDKLHLIPAVDWGEF